jgi:hypothetical protein
MTARELWLLKCLTGTYHLPPVAVTPKCSCHRHPMEWIRRGDHPNGGEYHCGVGQWMSAT